MSTVLPTPAPPNSPILPPSTYGVSRSMTLMPVSNICVRASSWSKAGALRWMPQRSVAWKRSPSLRLSTSPIALKTWPLVLSPTGTVIGPPVSVTTAPRTMPSVGCIEMARTRLSPRCWATSRVSIRVVSPRVTSTCRALYISGIASAGNSMSTTGPITRDTRPVPACADSVELSFRVAVIASLTLLDASSGGRASSRFGRGVRESVGTADDLADLLRDLRFASVVRQQCVAPDQLVGVVRRRLHRALPGGELAGRRHQQRVEHPGLDVPRQQRVEHGSGVRLELVQRQDLVLRRGLVALDDLQREQPDHLRLLRHGVDEPGVDDVVLVDAALARVL